MTDLSRIQPSHTARASYIYVRQSSPSEVEHNRGSAARRYALADRGLPTRLAEGSGRHYW